MPCLWRRWEYMWSHWRFLQWFIAQRRYVHVCPFCCTMLLAFTSANYSIANTNAAFNSQYSIAAGHSLWLCSPVVSWLCVLVWIYPKYNVFNYWMLTSVGEVFCYFFRYGDILRAMFYCIMFYCFMYYFAVYGRIW